MVASSRKSVGHGETGIRPPIGGSPVVRDKPTAGASGGGEEDALVDPGIGGRVLDGHVVYRLADGDGLAVHIIVTGVAGGHPDGIGAGVAVRVGHWTAARRGGSARIAQVPPVSHGCALCHSPGKGDRLADDRHRRCIRKESPSGRDTYVKALFGLVVGWIVIGSERRDLRRVGVAPAGDQVRIYLGADGDTALAPYRQIARAPGKGGPPDRSEQSSIVVGVTGRDSCGGQRRHGYEVGDDHRGGGGRTGVSIVQGEGDPIAGPEHSGQRPHRLADDHVRCLDGERGGGGVGHRRDLVLFL